VRLLFPLSRPTEDAPVERPREASIPSAHAGEHVLLIDDEDMLRTTLCQALELRGVEVDTAVHGADGLARLRTAPERFTAVILDVTMPVMDGPTALAELRKTHPHLPVVLISGYTEDNVGAGFAPGEPTAFLQKPFGTTLLLSTIADLRRRLDE
jgi:CheY-like chemotaxis protein